MLKDSPVIVEIYKDLESEFKGNPSLTLIAPITYNFDEINAYAKGACEALGCNHFILWYQ